MKIDLVSNLNANTETFGERMSLSAPPGYFVTTMDFGALMKKEIKENDNLVVTWICTLSYKRIRKIEYSASRKYSVTEVNVSPSDEQLRGIVNASMEYFYNSFDNFEVLKKNGIHVSESIPDEIGKAYVEKIKKALNSSSA